MGEHVDNEWWRTEYGDPCRGCGFVWDDAPEAVIAAVEAVPAELVALLTGAAGDQVPAGATWSAKAYVFHVADNLRIFAERLEGVFAGATPALAAYDENELAAARDYESMSLESALWSVGDAVAAWSATSREALRRPQLRYLHAERGALTPAEIVRAPGHDALHHRWDVRRAVRP
jgi:hypothetical protein